MHSKTLLAALALSVSTVTAFHPYIPDEHPHNGAVKNSMKSQIMKGFTFAGKEVPIRSEPGSAKARLVKRARPAGALNKRANDFRIESDNAPSAPNSAAIDQDGTDFSYFAVVTLGSEPGEKVYLLLDTGSSATWVMGSECSDTACQSHNTFGPSNSKTLQAPGSDSFSLSYGSGTVAGYIGTDSLSFAGMNLNMAFGLANTTSDNFDSYPMDGLLGLGRTTAGTGFDQPAFLQVVAQAKALKANVFGVHVDRHSDGNFDGEISFGAPDSARYSGSLNYMNTGSDQSTWNIPADDVLVNGKSVNLKGKTAVLDTGTTYLFMPPSDAEAVFSQIPNATPAGDVYHLPCDTTTSISFVFNGVQYSVSPKDYVGPSVGGGLCYTHIIGQAAVGGDPNKWLLGDVFLKNVYSVFDVDKNRIGLGTLSSGSSPSGGSPTSPSTSPKSGGASPNDNAGTPVSGSGSPSGNEPLALPDEASPTSTGTGSVLTLTPVPQNSAAGRTVTLSALTLAVAALALFV